MFVWIIHTCVFCSSVYTLLAEQVQTQPGHQNRDSFYNICSMYVCATPGSKVITVGDDF